MSKTEPRPALLVAQTEAVEAMRALQRAQARIERHRLITLPERTPRPSCEPLCGGDAESASASASMIKGSIDEDEEDADYGRTMLSHLRPPWKQRITWYKGPKERPYSRRELLADTIAHFIGIVLAVVGNVLLALRVHEYRPPLTIALSVTLYGLSSLAMILLSTVFNLGQARFGHRRPELRTADHAGICLMIAGTYTPFMAYTCTLRELGFVWGVGLFAILARYSRGCCDVWPVHVTCFLLMGWSCLSIWEELRRDFDLWACQAMMIGGALYTIGLVPWLSKPVEFHVAMWHVFVVVAGAVFFFIIYEQIATAQYAACHMPLDQPPSHLPPLVEESAAGVDGAVWAGPLADEAPQVR